MIGNRRGRQGITLIEVLTASLIVSVCLFALMNLLGFSFRVTQKSDEWSVGYSLARLNIERMRGFGFKYAPEGTHVLYYDGSGGNESKSQLAESVLKATVTVTSDKLAYNPYSNTYKPSDDAIRTVVVTITNISENAVVHRVGTLLVRSGI